MLAEIHPKQECDSLLSGNGSNAELSLSKARQAMVAGLKDAGIEQSEARQEAELAIEHVTGLKLAEQMCQTTFLNNAQKQALDNILSKRQERFPLQYCLGHTYFAGLKLKVCPGVFIPRPDTETLVEIAYKQLKNMTTAHIVEIGTGSGAIAIALLKRLPHVQITAIDLNPNAVALTYENAVDHQVLERLTIINQDWIYALPETIDAIVTNPPYIPEPDIKYLQPEIGLWEPKLALSGGEDGLAFYRQLSKLTYHKLSLGGFLATEIGDKQADDVVCLFKNTHWEQIDLHLDLDCLPRVLLARPRK